MQKRFYFTLAHLALLASSIIYGLNFSIAKSVMPDSIKPLALVSLRTLVTGLLFWFTSLFLPKEHVDRKDLFYLLGCSFLSVIINQMLFLAGLNLTTPVNSSIIIALTPVAALAFSSIILRERISLLKGTGMSMGFAGIILLILNDGRPDLTSSRFVGNIYTFINMLSWSLYTVVIKKMLEKYNPVTVMKWTFLFGIFITVPAGYPQWSTNAWSEISVNGWLSIGFVAIFSTYLGYFLISFGLKRLSPTIVNTYTYIQTAFAAFVASLAGQDTLSVVKIVSAIMIFAGVWLVSLQPEITITAEEGRSNSSSSGE
ncbi:MAG: DMT family transporter [Bacteroidales bacterium]